VAERDPVRVLIVDDHKTFADALKLLLDRSEGIDVVGVAYDGPKGIDLAMATDPHVVLMDIRLPTMDGFETTGRLHAIKKAAKVIAVTGRSDETVREETAACGMVAYLCKDDVVANVISAITIAAHSSG
jgi:DNA-binding NarL/FixJ family response regulator